nr:hypothetical protein [Propioniciclava coleopterorum]
MSAPCAPFAKRSRTAAASSVPTSTGVVSASLRVNVSTSPAGRRRVRCTVCRSANTDTTGEPVTYWARSSQWLPMSATARVPPPTASSTRQFQSVGLSSQSCR